MSTPQSLSELARWATEHHLAPSLDRRCREIFRELSFEHRTERVLAALCEALRARTLLQALRDPRAPATLAMLAMPAGGAAIIEDLHDGLLEFADIDDDDELDGLDAFGNVAMPSPAPELGVRRAAALAAVPRELPQVRAWAEQHHVADRLSDPIAVLGALLYQGDVYLAPILANPKATVADAFAPPPPAPRRTPHWEVNARANSHRVLANGARQYLDAVATTRALVLAQREAKAQRARPPSDPHLVALIEKIEALRAELAGRVTERPVGTYRPMPSRVEEGPLRIVYIEAADLRFGVRNVRATLSVEDEPLRVACDCLEGSGGACPHALTALDAALELLRDPDGDAGKLGAIMAVPVWQRFLRAFGDELTLRQAPAAAEEARLAWRITWSGGAPSLELLIQKRLKGGGWSQGSRARLDEVLRRRELLVDPHDARAVRAFAAGFEEMGMSHGYVSSGRLLRTLEALVGHPRVYLESKPARVTRERLRVALDSTAEGVAVSFFLGARRYGAGELLALVGKDGEVISVDVDAGVVVLGALDERATALLAAFEKHPARFPPESHDDLVRGLAPLQASVELALPEALVGEPVDGDARPIVRLSPRDSGEVEVEVLVRPVEGGPTFPPGEGPPSILHALAGRRVSARRDLAAEVAFAAPVMERLAVDHGPRGDEAPAWTFQLGEEATLDFLAALRELGDGVVVEWPEPDKRFSLTSAISRKELRIRVLDRRDWFGVEGEVEIDGDTVPLTALLDAVRRGRRYVRVGPGKFAAIEDELRQRVSAADDVLHPGRKGLEVTLPGVAMLEGLVESAGHLEAAVRWRELVARLDAARALEPEVPAALTATLRPYQAEGFRWLMRLAAWGAGACLADDMGLGKTVQALALLLARADRGPTLVIAPTSVGPNWLREAERFAPTLRARLYRGLGRAVVLAEAGPGDLLITSYSLAVRDAEALGAVRFGTLILDEAQAIKNALTRRARAIADLDAELRVALTGTPVENHLGELWSLMRVLTPGLLGSWEHFRDRFAGPIERSHDAGRSAALSRLVRPFLLRRTKAEVAPELPPRTEIERFVDLSAAERRLYDDARRAALEQLAMGEGDARFAIFAALTRLRRLACHPRLLDDGSPIPSSKLAALLETVRELREEGHRALVFSQFTSHLALVREALEREGITYTYLDGSTPSEERTRRIDAFQGGDTDLFLISLKAGGTGLNLTAADYVIHLDPWWNPAVEDQATDRAHRIGQTKAVTVIRLVARGTIEEAVLALHKDKRALAASVFDEEGSPARLSAEELAALIRAGATDAPNDDEGDAAGDEVVSSGEDREVQSSRPPRKERAVKPAAPVAKLAASVEKPAAPVAKPAAPVAKVEAREAEKVSEPAVVIAPPASPAPPVEAPPADTLVARVIDWLAEVRGGVDPRYDMTLRTYQRSLNRFMAYRLEHRGADAAAQDPTEEVIEAYLSAVNEGRWPAPASEKGIARTVMNHLRAYLQKRAPAR
jgi:superfamily II DNA or RNA helicase